MAMRTVQVELVSRKGSVLMCGKPVATKKVNSQTHEQYDADTWREKVHLTEEKHVCWPPFALKNALESAGKFLSMRIPGEGKKTFTDRFRKGVLIIDQMPLCGHDGKILGLDDVDPVSLFVPSDGKKGSSKRVWRTFPTIYKWKAVATIYVADDKIDDDVLLEHLTTAGQFIGFGSMRVEHGGTAGMFTATLLA